MLADWLDIAQSKLYYGNIVRLVTERLKRDRHAQNNLSEWGKGRPRRWSLYAPARLEYRPSPHPQGLLMTIKKERPILFSAPMIRALLNGSKTQTRRALNARTLTLLGTAAQVGECNHLSAIEPIPENDMEFYAQFCPHGKPGDKLWVRETWADVGTMDPGLIVYRADYPACVPEGYENVPPAEEITWKPSIHMFRRASRITLEITGVRVERLQGISEADAISEGINYQRMVEEQDSYDVIADHNTVGRPTAITYYRDLWESINGRPKLPANTDSKRYARVKRWLETHPDTSSWDANPWVWVIEFRRI